MWTTFARAPVLVLVPLDESDEFDAFYCRLTAAGADYGLYLLTKSSSEEENIFPFGRGLSGHHGKVHEMAYCGGKTEDSSRYLATVSGVSMTRWNSVVS